MVPRLLLCLVLARLEPPPDYLRQNCDVEKSSCGANSIVELSSPLQPHNHDEDYLERGEHETIAIYGIY
jgi:hypothetical protein